jgi:HD-GYP domain-containing protein (c-di-GMP phosphodiesterase class II)
VIRQHHERYDGGGYPDGLAGDEISLAARIVAVADVWDALTPTAPYATSRPACGRW